MPGKILESRAMKAPPLRYSYRPRPLGGEIGFRLDGNGLAVTAGARETIIAYGDIGEIRLMFAPGNLSFKAFQATIGGGWRAPALSSSTWKSLVEQREQDGDYRFFVTGLIRKVSFENPALRLLGGTAPWRYWTMLVSAAAIGGIFLWIIGGAVSRGQFPAAAIIAAFTAWFGYWAKNFFARNLPCEFTADTIPEHLLPADK